MENKILRDFKEDVAKAKGFKNWESLFTAAGSSYIQKRLHEAAEMYAQYISEQACKQQRRICFKHAKISMVRDDNDRLTLEIDPNSILHAPLATEII